MTFSETVDSGRTRRGRPTLCLRHGTEVGSKRVDKNVSSQGLNCPNSEASGKSCLSSFGTLFYFDQLRRPKCR